MGCNLDTWASLADKRGNCISLEMAHVLLPEHELPVQVGEINSVHIHQVNISGSAQRQVLDDFAAQSACPHHHDGSLEDSLIVERPFFPILLKGSCIGKQGR